MVIDRMGGKWICKTDCFSETGGVERGMLGVMNDLCLDKCWCYAGIGSGPRKVGWLLMRARPPQRQIHVR